MYYADRPMLFDCMIPTIANFYESVEEEKIDENDLKRLTDASEMSEDEDVEQNRRKLWS